MKFYVSLNTYVGNNLCFWRKGGHGYSCNLLEAEVFEEGPELESIRKSKGYDDRPKYKIWDKEKIDSMATLQVSM